MNEKNFVKLCKKILAEHVQRGLDPTDSERITEEDVYVVWLCKTLQNNKALLSTTLPDGMYYEFTYNGDKNELYVDSYKRFNNFVIKP